MANNEYYAKFGFVVKKRFTLGGDEEQVVLWAMVREPQSLKLVRPSSGSTVTIRV